VAHRRMEVIMRGKRSARIFGQRRWTSEEASEALAEAGRSGLSLGAFAAREGVNPERLYRWRRNLPPVKNAPEKVVAPIVSFEEVPVGGPRPGAEDRFEVELRAGTVVRFGASFDEAGLRRLLRILADGAAC
jgi:transposase-like protein